MMNDFILGICKRFDGYREHKGSTFLKICTECLKVMFMMKQTELLSACLDFSSFIQIASLIYFDFIHSDYTLTFVLDSRFKSNMTFKLKYNLYWYINLSLTERWMTRLPTVKGRSQNVQDTSTAGHHWRSIKVLWLRFWGL